jgi:hypothetical protein
VARTLAIVGGAALWGAGFSFLGSLTQRPWSGAACGVVIGAIIGYGFTKNLIGKVVVWVSVFAVLGAVLGPGCDADACHSAIGGAVIGCLFGWFGWIGAAILVFGNLGLFVGNEVAGAIGAVVGMVLGAMSVPFAVYLDRRTAVKVGGNISDLPSQDDRP